jgi:hypothetical protein
MLITENECEVVEYDHVLSYAGRYRTRPPQAWRCQEEAGGAEGHVIFFLA